MPRKSSSDTFISYPEIADELGVTVNTLRQWANRGKLPEPDVRVGQSPAWRRSTLAPWLRANKRETPAAAAPAE